MSLYSRDPKDFTFQKPENWPTLPLYAKIRIYKGLLTHHYAPYIDKLTVKTIVKEICGDSLKTAKVIRILDGPDDIRPQDINPNYMIKTTHASGWNLNIQPNTVVPLISTRLRTWNRTFTAVENGEVQYKFVQPRFFIEEKINDIHTGKSGKATVFMIRCIHGRCESIRVVHSNGKSNSYTIDWTEEEPLTEGRLIMDKPPQLNQMLTFAKQLSKPFEFVRVDFYLSKEGDIYFSEFTFTPGGGTKYFSDEKELALGKLWQ